MIYGSVFTGIGGFDLGLDQAGMTCAWQIEKDRNCLGVLSHRWPNTRKYKDIKNVRGETLAPVNLIVGGFPCQDLSVAGKRAGLAGERSGLWFEFRRILTETKPEWVVIENVPGLLSSNGGRDFAIVLRGLVKCGYGVCWRVFDAQYFGLAQRRRRVFIVGHLGDGRAAEVLFERESRAGDTAPRREAGQGAAGDAVSGFSETGQGYWGDGIAPLRAEGENRPSRPSSVVAFGGNNTAGPIDVATACNAHGGTGRSDFESETFVGYNIMPQNSAKDYKAKETEVSQCLTTGGNHSGDQGGTYIAWYENKGGSFTPSDHAKALRSGESHSYQGVGVRRLTPTECERLQGFPDGWTEFGFAHPSRKYIAECAQKGRVSEKYVIQKMSDSIRYRQLGNAVAVPVIYWIGKRILGLHEKDNSVNLDQHLL